jgi:hypothetical protein
LVYVLARLFDGLHVQARPEDPIFSYPYDGYPCHLQASGAPEPLAPHDVSFSALPQHLDLEVRESLEHARPVLVHLFLVPEAPVRVGWLLGHPGGRGTAFCHKLIT